MVAMRTSKSLRFGFRYLALTLATLAGTVVALPALGASGLAWAAR